MNSRERVLTAFAHRQPDRVPAWCGASPEFRELARRHLGLPDDESLSLHLGDDFRRVYARKLSIRNRILLGGRGDENR